MNNLKKFSNPAVSSSILKKKSISKIWLALIFIFLTLTVILVIATISLFFYQKVSLYSPPENIWNPEEDLNEFITSSFSNYYKPAIIQPEELINLFAWEYSWDVEEEHFNAFVEYNEENKKINRITGSAILDEDIYLDENSAIKLLADVFGGVIPGGEWDCGSLVVESYMGSSFQCKNKWIINKDKYEVMISKLKDAQLINVDFCIIPNNSKYYENENCFE
jgi:hypothetical protein